MQIKFECQGHVYFLTGGALARGGSKSVLNDMISSSLDKDFGN